MRALVQHKHGRCASNATGGQGLALQLEESTEAPANAGGVVDAEELDAASALNADIVAEIAAGLRQPDVFFMARSQASWSRHIQEKLSATGNRRLKVLTLANLGLAGYPERMPSSRVAIHPLFPEADGSFYGWK